MMPGSGRHQRDDELVQADELAVQELSAPAQLTQRDTGGVAGDVAGAGTQRRQPGYQGSRLVLCEPCPQVIRAGQDQCPSLVDGPGAFSGRAAPGDHQGPDRLHGAVPALGGSASPAGLRGPGSADRVQRVGLALPAPVLPVGAVPLDDPDARRGDITGQPGAVTAGSLDADQAYGAEPGQPAQQSGVAGRGGGELPDAEQPADGIERGGDMGICVSARAASNRGAAGNGACFSYDGHCHPFLRLRDGTHPLAAGPVNPGLLHRTGRSDRHRRQVPVTLGQAGRSSRRTARTASADSEVRPGPRLPTLRPYPVKTGEAGPEALSTVSLSGSVRIGRQWIVVREPPRMFLYGAATRALTVSGAWLPATSRALRVRLAGPCTALLLRLAAPGAGGRPRRAFQRKCGGLVRIVVAGCAAGITVQLGGSMLAGAADP